MHLSTVIRVVQMRHLAAHHTWYGAYLRKFWASGCCSPPFNLFECDSFSSWCFCILLHVCAHLCACTCFLNPVFKISPGFGFMPGALGILLCFCFVLTSTCLDLFHASLSLLSTKLPVQDSPVNQKKRWEWRRKGFENGQSSGKKQTSNCFEPKAL